MESLFVSISDSLLDLDHIFVHPWHLRHLEAFEIFTSYGISSIAAHKLLGLCNLIDGLFILVGIYKLLLLLFLVILIHALHFVVASLIHLFLLLLMVIRTIIGMSTLFVGVIILILRRHSIILLIFDHLLIVVESFFDLFN